MDTHSYHDTKRKEGVLFFPAVPAAQLLSGSDIDRCWAERILSIPKPDIGRKPANNFLFVPESIADAFPDEVDTEEPAIFGTGNRKSGWFGSMKGMLNAIV